jgi:hypothetical protein
VVVAHAIAAKVLEGTEEGPLVAAVELADQGKLSPAALPLARMNPAVKTPITRKPAGNVLSLLYVRRCLRIMGAKWAFML